MHSEEDYGEPEEPKNKKATIHAQGHYYADGLKYFDLTDCFMCEKDSYKHCTDL